MENLLILGISILKHIIISYELKAIAHVNDAESIIILAFKDHLPYSFHGFRNKCFNKISLDNVLYYHS